MLGLWLLQLHLFAEEIMLSPLTLPLNKLKTHCSTSWADWNLNTKTWVNWCSSKAREAQTFMQTQHLSAEHDSNPILGFTIIFFIFSSFKLPWKASTTVARIGPHSVMSFLCFCHSALHSSLRLSPTPVCNRHKPLNLFSFPFCSLCVLLFLSVNLFHTHMHVLIYSSTPWSISPPPSHGYL